MKDINLKEGEVYEVLIDEQNLDGGFTARLERIRKNSDGYIEELKFANGVTFWDATSLCIQNVKEL